MKGYAKKCLALFLSVLTVYLVVPAFPMQVGADPSRSDSFQIIRNDPAALDWAASEVAYIDFSEAGTIPLNGTVAGNGLTLLTTESTGNTRASNLAENGYLLLGKKARQNDNPADMETKPYVNGAIYLKLDAALSQKAHTSYAVRIDYFGGGISVDSNSFIDLSYYTNENKTVKVRNTYGATYHSGQVENMVYALTDANFSENNGSCQADFHLETWCGNGDTTGAQLKIKRVSVLYYEPVNPPAPQQVSKNKIGQVYSVDFEEIQNYQADSLLQSGTFAGDGLTLITSQSTGNTRASNLLEDGYLLLGKKARQNDNPADMGTKPYVNGAIYIKLNVSLEEKANTSYAVKIDYFGGGIGVDSGSYIDFRYNNTANNNNSNMRKTYGATYNSGEDQSLYYLVSNANFNETINGSSCGADFRLETWCGNGDTTGAQLKIKRISVTAYDPTENTDHPAAFFEREEVPYQTVFTNVNTGKYYGLTYPASAPMVKIIDKAGEAHYAVQSESYFGLKITDDEVKAAQSVTLSITYWDIGTTGFSVEYNAEVPNPLPDNTSENFYHYFSTSSFEMNDSKELLTIEIPLENTAFAGNQSGGNDLRIRTLYIPDFFIEEIAIKIGTKDITAKRPEPFPESTVLNDFTAKTVVGYQAWFKTSESKTGGWDHWSAGAAPKAGYGNQTFDVYPDVSDFPEEILYPTDYADLLSGKPALLYDGTSEEAIDTQVRWMRDYGIDGFAVSRFFTGTSEAEIQTRTKLDYMKEAAERYGRIFYMGYDLSGIGGYGEAGIKRLEADFVLNVEKKYVYSPNYAQAGGKPVVSLWGFQGSQFNRYPNTQNALSLIQWFQDRGYYVIGGCPDNNWAKDTSDYKTVYEAIDMISPWTVGRYNNNNAVNYLTNKYTQDKAWIDAFNAQNPARVKSYLPTIHPGFSWANWASGSPNAVPRSAGKYLWDQAKVTAEYGFTSSFIAMFDELDEGTAVVKMAEDSFSIPADQYFVTGAADGNWVSSDFYLRLTAAVGELLRGERTAAAEVPIAYSEGPVFWRNSFEKRALTYKNNSGSFVTGLFRVDVGVPNGTVLENTNVTVSASDAVERAAVANTGSYSFALSGSTVHHAPSSLCYKIANTKITLQENTVLSYSLYAENTLGEQVYVDLILDNGERLCDLQGGVNTRQGVAGDRVTVSIPVSGALAGRTVTAVAIAFEAETQGDFSAYIDDICIALSSQIAGDTDGDSTVNAQDLVCLKKALIGAVSKGNTDVNTDGKTDILDLVALRKKLAYTGDEVA